MLTYHNKNLFEDVEIIDVILHQENCISNYYKGFAKILRGILEIKWTECDRTFGGVQMGYNELNNIEIYNLFSQYYPGSPTNNREIKDDMAIRCLKLMQCLRTIEYLVNKDKYIAIPLIASGLASDKKLKNNMSDIEYFKTYIAPIIDVMLDGYNINVYYL